MKMLELNNLHKTFNPGTVNEKVALNGVSLHMEAGDFATIVGSNGAGKSTMLNAVAADDGNEIALVQLQVQTVQGGLLVHRACIEGFGNIFDLKHFLRPPLPF